MNRKVIAIIIAVLVIAVGAYLYISSNSQETMLSVTSASTLKNGDFFSVVLKDQFRNVYPGQVINVKILDDTGWAHYYNATTDQTGQANILLEGLENGNYTVHATFNGTTFLHKCKSVSELQMYDGMG